MFQGQKENDFSSSHFNNKTENLIIILSILLGKLPCNLSSLIALNTIIWFMFNFVNPFWAYHIFINQSGNNVSYVTFMKNYYFFIHYLYLCPRMKNFMIGWWFYILGYIGQKNLKIQRELWTPTINSKTLNYRPYFHWFYIHSPELQNSHH